MCKTKPQVQENNFFFSILFLNSCTYILSCLYQITTKHTHHPTNVPGVNAFMLSVIHSRACTMNLAFYERCCMYYMCWDEVPGQRGSAVDDGKCGGQSRAVRGARLCVEGCAQREFAVWSRSKHPNLVYVGKFKSVKSV